MKHEEHDSQKIVVRWFLGYFPQYKNLLQASNSGVNVGPRVGMRLRELGLCPGEPDLFFAIPVSPYHGLYIEMKTQGGRISPIQKEVHDDLREMGFLVMVCWTSNAAIAAIQSYLTPRFTYNPTL